MNGLYYIDNIVVKECASVGHSGEITDTYIISVPTPYDAFNKKVDAGYVVSALQSVLRVAPKGATVVVESTVSPGTIDKFVRPVIKECGFVIGEDINLVHAPERIIPGNMVYVILTRTHLGTQWRQCFSSTV